MKLTKRQDAFIKNLLDLYKEAQEPIHYSLLAEKLGVSKFTAYDMLRVLEDKGFVSSEFKLPTDSKTGRSERVFFPTDAAHKLISAITSDDNEFNWDFVKEKVLELVQSGEYDNLDVGPELLARVPPENEDSIQYCIEIVTIMALHVRKNEAAKVMRKYIVDLIPSEQITHKAYLSFLGGFALGTLAHSEVGDSEWIKELIPHVIKFQEYVLDFNQNQCRQLSEGIREHFSEMFLFFPDDGIDIKDFDKLNLK